jgi:hypothetical protein
MIDTDIKVRENKCRRAAERRGMRLLKSSQRDHKAIGFGLYHLVVRFQCFKDAARTRGLVNRRAEINAPGMAGLRKLDEVEAYLFGDALEQTVPEISAEA